MISKTLEDRHSAKRLPVEASKYECLSQQAPFLLTKSCDVFGRDFGSTKGSSHCSAKAEGRGNFGRRCVCFITANLCCVLIVNLSAATKPVLKSRNFDPESRTLRKRTDTEDVSMDDTVEKNVEGLAEKILAEDEQRRNQDLVS